jgi:hypothetical protein
VTRTAFVPLVPTVSFALFRPHAAAITSNARHTETEIFFE